MNLESIAVLVSDHPEGGSLLRAPKVGMWSGAPQDGAIVGPGSSLGRLTQLRRRFALRVPENVSGRVEIAERPHETLPVEYGGLLCRILPLAAPSTENRAHPKAASRERAEGSVIVAPTDGVFYRSPAAGARPYVAVGDRVATGQPLGLIEVMKTFNPIVYGGAGLPDEAEIVEVLVPDEAEVRAGQPLVRVKKP